MCAVESPSSGMGVINRTVRIDSAVMRPKDADGMTNSASPGLSPDLSPHLDFYGMHLLYHIPQIPNLQHEILRNV